VRRLALLAGISLYALNARAQGVPIPPLTASAIKIRAATASAITATFDGTPKSIGAIGPIFNPLAASYNSDPTGQSAYTAAGGTGTVYVPQGGTLALTGSITGTSGVTSILANGSGVTGGYSLPGIGDATAIGNSGQIVGRYTTATVNNFGLVGEISIGVTGSSSAYEDAAVYGNCQTSDPTSGPPLDCVGGQFTGVSTASNTLGSVYGISANAKSITGGDAHLSNEFDVTNNSANQTLTGQTNSKYAFALASKGTNPATAALYVFGGATAGFGGATAGFDNGIVFAPGSIAAGATGAYWEGFSTVGSATVETSAIYASGMVNGTFLSIGGNGPQSAPAWLSGGIALSQPNTNYTDASSTGTINEEAIDGLGNGTLSAANAITVNNLDTIYIPPPVAGTNVTATNLNAIDAGGNIRGIAGEIISGGVVSLNANSNFAVNIATGSSTATIGLGGSSALVDVGALLYTTSKFGVGPSNPTGYVEIGGAKSSAAWGNGGLLFRTDAATLTDTTSTGSAGNVAINTLGVPTIAAQNTGVTYGNASTLYIAGAPAAGTNVTLSSPYSLFIAGGTSDILGPIIANGGGVTITGGLTADGFSSLRVNGTTASTTAGNDYSVVINPTLNPTLTGNAGGLYVSPTFGGADSSLQVNVVTATATLSGYTGASSLTTFAEFNPATANLNGIPVLRFQEYGSTSWACQDGLTNVTIFCEGIEIGAFTGSAGAGTTLNNESGTFNVPLGSANGSGAITDNFAIRIPADGTKTNPTGGGVVNYFAVYDGSTDPVFLDAQQTYWGGGQVNGRNGVLVFDSISNPTTEQPQFAEGMLSGDSTVTTASQMTADGTGTPNAGNIWNIPAGASYTLKLTASGFCPSTVQTLVYTISTVMSNNAGTVGLTNTTFVADPNNPTLSGTTTAPTIAGYNSTYFGMNLQTGKNSTCAMHWGARITSNVELQ
jgi:hypothetical protein